MKITRIETIPVRVPIRPQLMITAARGTHAVSPFLLVRIHTNEGVVGLGEVSCTPRWSGEDQVSAAHFIRHYMAPLLEDQDPTAVERLALAIDRAVARNYFTKAAIEMALWDICGKIAGLPVYRLLGGPVRESVPTKWSVSGVEPSNAAAIAAWAVDQGFDTMKVKVGIEPDADVARVAAVRARVGPDVRLGVDANGGWRRATAIAVIERLYESGVYFVEQPLAAPDVLGMAEVRRRIRVPVIADESVFTEEDAAAVTAAGAADALSVYIGKAGGIAAARRIVVAAEAAGVACTVGSNLEMGIGSAAMIHLAMSTRGVSADEFPCDIIGPLYYDDDLLLEPLPISGGRALAFDRPGLGVELDDEKVRRYRIS